MVLVGQDVLAKAMRKHANAKRWLRNSIATVEEATWQSLNDIRQDYSSADGVKLKTQIVVTVFNVKENEYRLLTIVNFENQIILVVAQSNLSEMLNGKRDWSKAAIRGLTKKFNFRAERFLH